MPEFNCDFHIHSKYSGGTSKDMELPLIARQAELKGLHVVGTGDALHPGWISHLKEHLIEEDGLYKTKASETRFIIQTEVEDDRRVHHVIMLPSIGAAEDLSSKLAKYSVNINSDGRPNVRLNGEQIVGYVKDEGGLAGPSHAFTPWTSLYKEYNSISDCYGSNLRHVSFLELGLSADTDMADRIHELQDVTFMSNSDCHSPWPQRLGREFNRISVEELSFSEIVKAIRHESGRKFTLNAGLNPREGKYHITACTRCYTKFRMTDAVKLKMRCPECRGLIKKGVADRIEELASEDSPRHPSHRPPYMHILPLAEVIALAMKINNPNSKKVKDAWDKLVSEFKTEINILLDEPTGNIAKANKDIAAVIDKLRRDEIHYDAGGGGKYGTPSLEKSKENYYSCGQKTLKDW
ncbi:MAG: TIGR00375 family protein [Candidatus Altiarchaeota archaeon]|nr:TIGR00375 family protein [Candidatus Altiarchaeota archaeon]